MLCTGPQLDCRITASNTYTAFASLRAAALPSTTFIEFHPFKVSLCHVFRFIFLRFYHPRTSWNVYFHRFLSKKMSWQGMPPRAVITKVGRKARKLAAANDAVGLQKRRKICSTRWQPPFVMKVEILSFPMPTKSSHTTSRSIPPSRRNAS